MEEWKKCPEAIISFKYSCIQDYLIEWIFAMFLKIDHVAEKLCGGGAWKVDISHLFGKLHLVVRCAVLTANMQPSTILSKQNQQESRLQRHVISSLLETICVLSWHRQWWELPLSEFSPCVNPSTRNGVGISSHLQTPPLLELWKVK